MAKKRHVSESSAPGRMRAGPFEAVEAPKVNYHRMTAEEKRRFSRRLTGLRQHRVSSRAEHLAGVAPRLLPPAPPTFRCTWCGTEVTGRDAVGHADRCSKGTP
jgi:hypothetical protein